MSEGFGLGDGSKDFSDVRGLADTKVSEAKRRRGVSAGSGHWPEAGTVIRVLIAALAAVVVLGWAVTAING